MLQPTWNVDAFKKRLGKECKDNDPGEEGDNGFLIGRNLMKHTSLEVDDFSQDKFNLRQFPT